MSEFVLSEVENGIRTITLNRPEKLNAVNSALVAQTLETFRGQQRRSSSSAARGALFAPVTTSLPTPTTAPIRKSALVDRIQAITREIVLGNQNARGSRSRG